MAPVDPKLFHKHADISVEFDRDDDLVRDAELRAFDPLNTRVPSGTIFGFLTQHTRPKRGREKQLISAISEMPVSLRHSWDLITARWQAHRKKLGADRTHRRWMERAGLTETPAQVVRRIDATLGAELKGNRRSAGLLDALVLDESVAPGTFGPLKRMRELHPLIVKPKKSTMRDEYDQLRKTLRTEVARVR